jgi:muramoyltetrapeptide carboxypeptidase LdcA involved in peptidoglycan recycling
VIKPRKLRPGDTVAAISLSWGGAATFPRRYEAGKKQFQEEFGVHVIEARHALRDAAWLEKNPKARADDLMEAFADHRVAGIVSVIGGNESMRLWPYLDFDIITSNPKVFLGYSDTTVSHLACLRAGLVSFYGPAFMAGFAENGGMFPYMVESVRRTIFSSDQIGQIKQNMQGWTVERLNWASPENQERRRQLNPSTAWRFLQGGGRVQGLLVGGCLEVLAMLRGTPLWPTPELLEGAILFFETSEEGLPPEFVKRELRSLAAMGVLRQLSGMLFARPGGAVSPDMFPGYDEAILGVLAGEEGLTDMPVVTNMDFGHTDPMFVLPYGVMAEIDCDKQTLSISENAVTD